MAVRYIGTSISGIASDSKPTPTANEMGVIFVETDTNKFYQWDTDSWNEISPTTVLVTDNESTSENNLIPFVANAATATGQQSIEMDGDFHYNPGSGTVTATTFSGTTSGAVTATSIALNGNITTAAARVWTLMDNNASALSFDAAGKTGILVFDTQNGAEKVTMSGDLLVSGDLTVSGTETTVSSTTINVVDPLVALATTNTTNAVDIGFYGRYRTNGTNLYTGLVWDAGASKYILFHGNQAAPTTTVNTGGTGHTTSTLIANLEGAVTGNADSATLASTVTVADSTDTTSFIAMFDSATGSLAAKTDAGITYNAGTGMLTATGFTGPLTGTASVATTVTATANNSTNETVYLTFVDGVSGTQGIETDSGLYYNPSTGLLFTNGAVFADGGEIGVQSDANLLTLASGALTVAGTTDINSSVAIGSGGATPLANVGLLIDHDITSGYPRQLVVGNDGSNNSAMVTNGGGNTEYFQVKGNVTINSGVTQTHLTSAAFYEPDITNNGTISGFASTVYIGTAPSEAPAGYNYALFVDAGNSRFDGGVSFDGYDNAATRDNVRFKSQRTTGNDTYLRIGRYGTGDDGTMSIGNNFNRNSGFAADNTSVGVSAIQFNTDGSLDFQTAAAGTAQPTDKMRIQPAGNIGIGNTSPDQKLTIGGHILQTSAADSDNSNKYALHLIEHYDTDDEEWPMISGWSQAASHTLALGGFDNAFNAATEIKFYTAANVTTRTGSERMTILSDGKIGMGISPVYLTHIYGAEAGEGTALGQLAIQSSTAFGSTPDAGIIFLNQHTSGSQAIMGGIKVTKANTNDTDLDSTMSLQVRKHGATAHDWLKADENDSVWIGAGSTLNGIRYFDLYNASTAATTDAIDIRLITRNTANNGTSAVNLVKRYNGEFTINNADTHADAYLRLYVGSTTTNGIHIANTGRVGIGTTAPHGDSLLDIRNGTTYVSGDDGSTAGTHSNDWLVRIQQNTNSVRKHGLSVMNAWANVDSVIFEAAMGWNGAATGYYPVFTIDGLGNFVFRNKDSGANTITEKMRFTTAGNLGIGVVPDDNAWSGNTVLQVGGIGTLFSGTSEAAGQSMWIGINTTQRSSSFNALFNDEASYIEQQNGKLMFKNAPAVSADAAQTFTERMTIHANGNAAFGNASDSGFKLDVYSGTSRYVRMGHASSHELYVYRNISGASAAAFRVNVDHASDGQAAIYIDQDGAGTFITGDAGGSVMFALNANGTIRLSGGSPADGKILTATDSNGNAEWEDAAAGGLEVGKVIALGWFTSIL